MKQYFLRVRLLILLLAVWGWHAGGGATTPANGPLVTAFNTYAQVPFVDDTGGLAADCVAYLNQKLMGAYRLQLDTIPRSRLMRLELAAPASFQGVVLFLHPRFVDDLQQQSYLWTQGLFSDANVLIFRGPRAPAVRSMDDLAGLRFGGSLDMRYKGLDELVERHKLTRIDSYSLRDSLTQVAAGRVDFTQTNATAFRAMAQQQVGFTGKFVSVPVPGEPEFLRHIMIGRGNADLAERLRVIVKAMPRDRQWLAIANRYALRLRQAAQSGRSVAVQSPVAPQPAD